MKNPFNKIGYTFIELILGVTILLILFASSIGVYSANTGNLDEATTGVVSKLAYTQEFAKVRDATKVVDIPHIELAKKKMNNIVEQNGVTYKYKDTPYINNLTNNIEVTTNLNNNKLYFSSQGYPIDESGKLLEDVRIYVAKKVLGVETKVYTITIDCTGNIEIIKSKDTSSKRTCSLANKVETLENIKVCAKGEEMYNGSCVKTCNYNQKRVNGTCKDICPSGQVYSSDGICKTLCNPTFVLNPTTKLCECVSGYEPFNGVCVEKCKVNETRNSTGICVCLDGYERVNGVCTKKCPSEAIRDSNGVCKYQGHTCNNRMDLFVFEQSGSWYSSSYAESFTIFTSAFNFSSPYKGTLFTTARVKASNMCSDGGKRGLFVDGSLTGQRRGTASDLTFTTTKDISAGIHNVRMGFDGDNFCGITGNYVKFTGVLCY